MNIDQLSQTVTDLNTDVPKTGISVTYADRVITIPIDDGDASFNGIIASLKEILNAKIATAGE